MQIDSGPKIAVKRKQSKDSGPDSGQNVLSSSQNTYIHQNSIHFKLLWEEMERYVLKIKILNYN